MHRNVWLRRLSLPSLAALLLGCGITKPQGSFEPDADGSAEVDLPSGVDQDGGTVDATVTCPPPLSTVCAAPAPSFAWEVVPILDARCNGCHDPALPNGPWPFHDYQDVLDWKGVFVDSLVNCTMPPADGGVALPEDERQRLFAWIACGAPDN